MCFQMNFKTSHRCIESELESSAKTKASTPLHNSSFAVAPSHFSNVGIIFTRVLFAKREKVVTRAYISLKYPFLAIHAKGGESISPKQKDRTHHHLILKEFFNWYDFSNWYLIVFKRGRE
jgi:predicted metal-dependent phosphoesterase TrpH